MNWNKYKGVVSSSRKIIVFPFFDQSLKSQSGIGVDIGCGDGDLTRHVAAATSAKIVGIDVGTVELGKARLHSANGVYYVHGDIEKNAIPSLGMKFDFAFSNCCFSHISDEGMYRVLVDLHSCMRDGGEVVFLVPSLSWAERMYQDHKFVASGITALPRYGGRQSFRMPEWYVGALEKCGFELISQREIIIPENDQLEERYRSNAGCPLFSAFVARRVEEIPDLALLQKAFEIAHDNRKLEIGLFWQRSLFFWGFVATALIGYGTTYGKYPTLTLMFSLFGLVCSVVWSAGNRGSKYWQEYWEEKVSFFQHYTTGNIFFDRHPKTPRMLDIFSARRISVSKLTMALSDYTVFLWVILSMHLLADRFYSIKPEIYECGPVVLALLTLSYCLYFLRNSNSED